MRRLLPQADSDEDEEAEEEEEKEEFSIATFGRVAAGTLGGPLEDAAEALAAGGARRESTHVGGVAHAEAVFAKVGGREGVAHQDCLPSP